MKRSMLSLCELLATMMIVVGIIWVAMNFHYMPHYGDSTEYIALSKTLKGDQYRGVVYPLAVRISDLIAFRLNIKNGFTTVLYTAQLALVFVSSLVFCLSLANKFADHQMTKWHAFACALIASFNPLSIHFALSVLTDSATASLVLLQAACLIHATGRDLPLKNFSAWLIATGLITIILSNLRIEKLYLSVFAFFGLGVSLLKESTRNTWMITYKKLSLLALSFVVTFFVNSLILSANTVSNPARPNLTLSMQLFNRAVWPRLSKTLPYLPTNIANTITPEQAEQFDSTTTMFSLFRSERSGTQLREPLILIQSP